MPKSKKSQRRKNTSDPKRALLLRALQEEGQGKFEGAAVTMRKVLEIDPGTPKHYHDLARLEAALGNSVGAAQTLRSGVDNCPSDATLPAQLAIMFAHSGRADMSPAAFALALQREDLPWARRQAAFYEIQIGDFASADRTLAPLLEADPGDAESLFVRALLRFSEGRYEQAWADYRFRWQVEGFFSPVKETQKPLWRGEEVDRLLVWREQGIGEEIQFLRFLTGLSGKAKSVLYEGDPRLSILLRRSFPNVDVRSIQNGELLPNAVSDDEFDAQVPLGDLGSALGGIGFGCAEPYLIANPEASAKLRAQFSGTFKGKKLIGLAWFSKNVEHGQGRSIPLTALLPIVSNPDYEFVAVQYGDVADILKSFQQETGQVIRNFTGIDLYKQVDQSCSVLAALDGLITIDNTTAHIAGGLGVPTALLLPKGADWRWHCPTLEGNGRIYKSHSIFRQLSQSDWSAPVTALKQQFSEIF